MQLTRRGAAILCAVLLATVPLWGVGAMIALMIPLGPGAFMVYLEGLQAYWSVPRALFGETLFPVQEFGIVPTGQGYAASAILYAAIGAGCGWIIAALFGPRRSA